MEKEMATHSSFLAWRIPWMEEPGGLQSMGLQRVGHNWSDLAQEDVNHDTWKNSAGLSRRRAHQKIEKAEDIM